MTNSLAHKTIPLSEIEDGPELHADHLFASLDLDLHLERIAGGNETEVYRTDDRRFVIKVKSDEGGGAAEALAQARKMKAAAETFARALGPEHSLPSYYLLGRDSTGQVQVIVVQPYLMHARPLFELDYSQLTTEDRQRVADQLEDIVWRALRLYWRTGGRMPDLYGRMSRSKAERRLLNAPSMLFRRLWSFLIMRNLLRSHNLLLTDEPECRVVLIDYDAIRQGWLYRLLYYTARHLLYVRDYLLIQLMRRGGKVPKG